MCQLLHLKALKSAKLAYCYQNSKLMLTIADECKLMRVCLDFPGIIQKLVII